MSAPSNLDCYLCGATNEPDASHCVRCSGQLLRLPSDEPTDQGPEEVAPHDDSQRLDEPPAVETKPREKRTTRKGSIADQRLSDALGMSQTVEVEVDKADEADMSLIDTVVTAIPRATPSSDIPLLGTRAGAVPQSAMRSTEFGKKTYILLGLLILVTSWVGYDTLTNKPDGPDSIAFTATTTTSSSSTTSTEKPRRIWQESDVRGYNGAFNRVKLYSCTDPGSPVLIEIDTASAVGVSLNEHNILLNRQGAGGADVAVVTGRVSSASRLAVIERTLDGSLVATSTTATTRNLQTDVAQRDTDEAFFLWYTAEDRDSDVATTRQNTDIEIAVSETGDPHTVYIGNDVYDVESLEQIDTRLEANPDVSVPSKPNVCERAAALRPVGAETPAAPSTDDDSEDPE